MKDSAPHFIQSFCAAALLLCASGAAAQTVGLSVNGNDDSLYEIDLSDGTATLVGAVGFSDVEGLALQPGTGDLFGWDDSTEELILVNRSTGAGTGVGASGISTSATVGLTFCPDGTLYLIEEGDEENLWSVDPDTGAATEIGSTGGDFNLTALACSPGGTLFAISDENLDSGSDTGTLYTVNSGTGVPTLVGVLGPTFVDGGAAFDEAGVLWALNEADGSIYTVDTGTGAATLVTTTSSGFESLTIGVALAASGTRATFEVTKDFSDDNPGEVDVSISCNTGLPLDQTKTITEEEGVTFVVTAFDDGELDCEITEAVPAGYDVEYDDGDTVSEVSCSYEDVNDGDELTCDITNTPAPVDIVIEKEWVFEGSAGPDGINTNYRLTLWCDAEIVNGTNIDLNSEQPAGDLEPGCGLIKVPSQESGQFVLNYYNWCRSFIGSSDAVFNAQVIPEYPDSHCYVVETVFDDAVEVDNGCDDLTVSVGQGASCTITNTVFYEGIPTLSQYGMAILALLMLGMGLVGFRRFA